jgi:integrase
MKNRYSIFPNGSRGGIYYLKDKQTGQRESLNTTDKARANELLAAKNESTREPAFNLQKARVYMAASDPDIATRTWADALASLIASKPEDSETRRRWDTFTKDKALKPILGLVVLETRAQQLLTVATARTVSTNVYLRRLHNFCIGMNWLPWPILPPKLWPKIKFKKKRGIKYEEHLRILGREHNPERHAFYELCWHLGGSQSDVANLEAEDIDWTNCTVCYDRQKLASLDESDVKPPIIKFGKRCAAVLRSLPSAGPLFPNLRKVKSKDRANEFRQRCEGLGIKGVTLHSYRYSWAERARKAGYPRRQAEEALGHNSKAVHIAYAKGAQVTVDSLEDYEDAAAKKMVRVEFAETDSPLPAARS